MVIIDRIFLNDYALLIPIEEVVMKKKLFISFLFINFLGSALFFIGCGDDVEIKTGGSGAVTAVQDSEIDEVLIETEIIDDTDNSSQINSSSLKNIFFKFDRYEVQADMFDRINEIANILKATNAKVIVEGNTDSFGSDEYNFALGKKRADSVKNALVSRGVDSRNISTLTFGESKPVCVQQTQECYQANRRVEFKIVQ